LVRVDLLDAVCEEGGEGFGFHFGWLVGWLFDWGCLIGVV
jgi:hypothetical protein